MKTIVGTKIVVTHVDAAAHMEYRIGKHANFYLAVVVDGAHDLEINISLHLVGLEAHATVLGMVRTYGTALVQFHTLQHHGAVGTRSNLLVKSVLTDRSKFSYDGSILVDPVAQKTDAYQRNENLLMDGTARATSEPALEILANDVRCTHGATIGNVNEEELWYLSTRGITAQMGRKMIADGFLRSAFSLIPDTIVRNTIEKRCRLPYV